MLHCKMRLPHCDATDVPLQRHKSLVTSSQERAMCPFTASNNLRHFKTLNVCNKALKSLLVLFYIPWLEFFFVFFAKITITLLASLQQFVHRFTLYALWLKSQLAAVSVIVIVHFIYKYQFRSPRMRHGNFICSIK